MPDTPYNNVSPEAFTTDIDQYEEMVMWRKNFFSCPQGSQANINKTDFRMVNNFNIANSFQGIAMKVSMILLNLLQKPSATSKSKEHSKVLEDRLNMWNNGDLNGLLQDCRATQRKQRSGKKQTEEDITRIFSKLVFKGKIGAVLKFLNENLEKSVLEPTTDTINKLKHLHPTLSEILPNTLLHGPIIETSTTTFHYIN